MKGSPHIETSFIFTVCKERYHGIRVRFNFRFPHHSKELPCFTFQIATGQCKDQSVI
uniref:Uncharacterized protein n=1 Tax=Rhizophora mucronata TaxID=61149 RepID=A0A2P2J8B4_RHIMU